MTALPRRAFMAGLVATLPGCATLGALDAASRPRPTFELTPVPGRSGARRALTLAVVLPDAPAAIDTDRILVKPDPLSVAYLPDAHWTEPVPALVQSLVIRSVAATGRVGHIGAAEGGPVPDVALILRIDAFQAEPTDGIAEIAVRIALSATLIRDRDQRLIASREFSGTAVAPSEAPVDLIPAFQRAIDGILPALADWTVAAI
ncbi:ABC-type transport auxiliary lipoprotein family protein [uncultured Jannaschia sp.]|uniref:ABC-type transport auxiliary lipoprotein family protein n=1 Tax=uncultured Jannaschia sp. TaxID=293347 RepID=UPI0026167386|nr:ABC-type transport auxiliary lipoprotein family protein [uncultured Jannaschia sp.]